MITAAQIQEHIASKYYDLLKRRPSHAIYEFIGFLDSLQKLGLITVDEAWNHSVAFNQEFLNEHS